MAGLKLFSKKQPRVTDARWNFDEEQKQADEMQQVQEEFDNTPSLTREAPSVENPLMSSPSMLSKAGSFMSQPGMGQAVVQGANMVSGTMDPEQTGMGPALSGAASGAMTGSMVFPGIGTAVGAAVGLGLGLIKAKSNREAIKKEAESKAAGIMAQGQQNAATALKNAMGNRPNYSGTRGLKL